MIAVVDYGMGNLRSVQKALEFAGAEAQVTSSPGVLRRCEKLVLPGVGAFGEAMRELKRRKLIEPIREAIRDRRYFLGLCLGLQLLFEKSEEAPAVKGLGILKGRVKRFRFARRSLKVPHMGWNNIAYGAGQMANGTWQMANGPKSKREPLKILKGVPAGSYMYFVHSYYAVPEDEDIILTTTDYGASFASGICKDNVYAFQFHPEKSQASGLRILKNFVNL